MASPAPPVVTPPIICFMGSHVAADHRVGDLERMLRSMLAQSPQLPPLSVSWSSTPELAPRVRAAFATAAAAGLPVEHVEQPTKTSQFEHLRALTALHAAEQAERDARLREASSRQLDLLTRQLDALQKYVDHDHKMHPEGPDRALGLR